MRPAGDAALRDITLTTRVCREPGADACVKPATRLVVVGGPARTCLVLRPHAARPGRQPVLARHGRKYDTDLTAVSMLHDTRLSPQTTPLLTTRSDRQ